MKIETPDVRITLNKNIYHTPSPRGDEKHKCDILVPLFETLLFETKRKCRTVKVCTYSKSQHHNQHKLITEKTTPSRRRH